MGRPREELFKASMAGDRDRLRDLLKKPNGADFSDPARAADAGRALSVAARYGDAGVIEELAAAGSPMDHSDQDFSPLVEALGSSYSNDETIKALINGGADVNRRTHEGVCAVSIAAVKGRAWAMTLLIEAGADVNIIGPSGEPALLMAIHQDGEETVQVLLKAGARANAKSDAGVSPLFKAASIGRLSMVLGLMKAGADVNARDNNGASALHGAAFNWNLECAQALVAAGADPEAKSHKGEDMLDCLGGVDAIRPARAQEQFRSWAEGVRISAREKRELAEAMSPQTDGPKAGELMKRARP